MGDTLFKFSLLEVTEAQFSQENAGSYHGALEHHRVLAVCRTSKKEIDVSLCNGHVTHLLFLTVNAIAHSLTKTSSLQYLKVAFFFHQNLSQRQPSRKKQSRKKRGCFYPTSILCISDIWGFHTRASPTVLDAVHTQ